MTNELVLFPQINCLSVMELIAALFLEIWMLFITFVLAIEILD